MEQDTTEPLLRMHVVCARCHEHHIRYEATHDQGLVPAVTPTGDVRFYPVADDELRREVNLLWRAEVGRREPYLGFEAYGIQRAMEESIDPAPTGEKYYLWGIAPCPHCGQLTNGRIALGTARTVHVPVVWTEHRTWRALPDEVKRRRIHRALNRLWVSLNLAPLPLRPGLP